MVRYFRIVFCSLLFALMILPAVYAGSLGMSPSNFRFDFKPGLEEMITIKVGDSDLNQLISISVSGDLSQYVNVSATSFVGTGELKVKLKLPKSIDKPGKHRILIGATENFVSEGKEMFGGASSVLVPIDIIVPYPGRYLEAEFNIFNANENEDIPYNLIINNLGVQDVNFSYEVAIFSNVSTSPLISFGNLSYLESTQGILISDFIKNSSLKPGNYMGFAKINYGSEINLNSSFRIGTFIINITDYDYQFIAGKINPFSIHTSSLWNSKINEVYMEVSVVAPEIIKDYFKSSSYSFEPLEEKNLTGYIDATNISVGRYVGNILLNYDGKSTSKLVAFYFVEPEITEAEKLLHIAEGVIVLLGCVTLFLLTKMFINRRNMRNVK
ncbi:MAG: hypothetical protein AABX11_03830 [Nanoarchaeota archaeon]